MRSASQTKLVDMDLSVRALNCLKAADVETNRRVGFLQSRPVERSALWKEVH